MARGREIRLAADGSTLLKGGRWEATEGGESSDAWGGEGERGGRAWQEIARAAGGRERWHCHATAAGRVQLTGGTGRPRCLAGSDGVRGERDRVMQR
jgi:hypothetical protein